MIKKLALKKSALKNKKGFTLIEIIVVLVILAVLAAASIPTMIGFVNDARGKAMIADARAVFIAGQSIATELQSTNAGGNGGDVIDADFKKDENWNRIGAMVAPDIKISKDAASATEAKVEFEAGTGAADKGQIGQLYKLTYTKIVGKDTVTIVMEHGKAAVVTIAKTNP